MFRHARLIVFSFALIVISAFCVVSALRPVFSVTALLVVEPARGDLLGASVGLPSDQPPGNATVDGAVEILRSEPVLRRALALVEPFERGDFSVSGDLRPGFLAFFRMAAEPLDEGEAGRAQALKLLRSAITINRRGLTPVIAITARATSPEFAARLANAVAEAQIELQLAVKAEAIGQAQALVDVQLESALTELAWDEAADSEVLGEVADTLNDGGAQPEVARLRQALAEAEAALLAVGPTGVVAEGMTQALAAEKHRSADYLRDELRAILLASGLPADVEARLRGIQEGAALAHQRYELLLERSTTLRQQALLQLPDARLAAPASAPSEAVFPEMKTTLAIAALLGLAVSLALAFTLDGLASGVRSTNELAEAMGVSAAIAVPRLDVMRFDGTSHADQVVKAPLSAFSESMRTLQVGLHRSLDPAGGGQMVFVLSASEGEGKTTTALGLARAFAATGQRVLLLDADVRTAALHRHVDVPLSGGFEQVLAGEVEVARIASMLRRDPLSNLSVLLNSGRSDVPAERLFGGPVFASVLRGVRASFDMTIVDMPSLTWSAELAHILPHADAAVVVASWGRTERCKLHDLLRAIRQAHPAPMPIMPVLALQPVALRWPAPRYEVGYSAR